MNYQTSIRRTRRPSLGIAALIGGAIVPVWATLAAIFGGLKALAWVPVIALFLFPANIVFFGLLIFAVLCGIFAMRDRGTSRALGLTGIILAAAQLAAAVAYLLWSATDMLSG